MKLPFKLPAIKLPKFGKKKADDEEDEDDDAFEDDVSEAEGDDEDESVAEEASDEDEEDPQPDDDLDDIDFSDMEDDDEEGEGEAGGDKKRKLLLIGGGAVAGLLLAGGVAWVLLSGDDEKKEQARDPSAVPKVSVKIIPKQKQAAAGKSLNALNADAVAEAGKAGAGQGKSLNAIAAGGATDTGGQVQVPVVSAAAFASIAPPAVADAPLDAGDTTDLREESMEGVLPKVASDGRKPWQVYAKPYSKQDDRPRVAIVIAGLGLSAAASDAAIRLLPGSVTLAFSPYAQGLKDWAGKARQAGHEVLIMAPLEPDSFPADDPGPQGLTTKAKVEKNQLRMKHLLSRMPDYVGVMTVMGSRFNASREHMAVFLAELKRRGLMVVQGADNADSLGPGMAKEMGLPYVSVDTVLDKTPVRHAVDAQLAKLEGVLGKQKTALAVAEAYPASLERIAAWLAGLEEKKLALVPVSALPAPEEKKEAAE